MSDPQLQHVEVHGHRRAFVVAGSGPALLLLHGLGCDHTTWLPALAGLAERHTVIAPDLLGHGRSDKPRADYSVGGYANGMRDLLTVLGVDRVTVVGHSFGGGVAMQFAYQFPERTERLVLVASGGLGPEVSPLLRAVTMPGFHEAMGVVTAPGVRHAVVGGLRALGRVPGRRTRDLGEVADIVESFRDPRARAAIRHVVRGVVDRRGQIITMADRAYLTESLPMCVVWGRDDDVIPVTHAENAARLAPGARVEVLDDSGHFPHKDHPDRFAAVIEDFVATTEPARHSGARWRRHLLDGPPVPAVQAEAGDPPAQPAPRRPRLVRGA
ncbi:alpha/beta fold hydrolase [Nocardioides sp. CPCC 205120]|uniref:alpha/beta fold hydrolase n=1 Tax=Nocardioides sp. CPCC 205120 TaxID=3406462 RepID=UPI003B509133